MVKEAEVARLEGEVRILRGLMFSRLVLPRRVT